MATRMLIGTFTIDCHLVMSSMSLSPEAFLPVPPQFMDIVIDDLSSVMPGVVAWTFTIINKELQYSEVSLKMEKFLKVSTF